MIAFCLAAFLKVMLFRVIRFGARDSLVLDGYDRLSIFIVKQGLRMYLLKILRSLAFAVGRSG